MNYLGVTILLCKDNFCAKEMTNGMNSLFFCLYICTYPYFAKTSVAVRRNNALIHLSQNKLKFKTRSFHNFTNYFKSIEVLREPLALFIIQIVFFVTTEQESRRKELGNK